MKTYTVTYKETTYSEAIIQAKTRAEAIKKLMKILDGVEAVDAWEVGELN